MKVLSSKIFLIQFKNQIQTLNKDYKDLNNNDFESNEQILKLHFFINILDRC